MCIKKEELARLENKDLLAKLKKIVELQTKHKTPRPFSDEDEENIQAEILSRMRSPLIPSKPRIIENSDVEPGTQEC